MPRFHASAFRLFIFLIFFWGLLPVTKAHAFSGEHPTLALGAAAPDFSLTGVDGKTYSLATFQKAKILVIVFTCNHCPTAQAYEDRIIQLTKDYSDRGVALLAIMPNDPKSIQISELGYTDMGDSFEEMKKRAATKHFNFPYLYDGDQEAAARAYGPVATPHVFIFDQDRKLRYQGRVDDVEKPSRTPNHRDAREAIEALLASKPVAIPTTKVFGCSVKWEEKEEYRSRERSQWAGEPVSCSLLDEQGTRALVSNHTDKLMVINVWATWCGPCVSEFEDLLTIYRMYRQRDFTFVTISADDPGKQDKVKKFLVEKMASCTNYQFGIDDKYKLIEAIDPHWEGALPYTLVVEPGGKVVFSKQGEVDPVELKRVIVDHPLIGRYY